MNETPENTTGATELTNMIKRMIKSTGAPPVVLDFGILNSDLSLSTNLFPNPIPKDHYSVCRSLLYNPEVPLTETYVDGQHGHPDASPPGTHYHEVILPKKMHWVKPGQKVLVGWVQGHEAVIIDIIYSGSWLGDCEPSW